MEAVLDMHAEKGLDVEKDGIVDVNLDLVSQVDVRAKGNMDMEVYVGMDADMTLKTAQSVYINMTRHAVSNIRAPGRCEALHILQL